MKILFLILTLFYLANLFGQENTLRKVVYDTNYTWRNSTSSEIDSFYYNLPVIKNSKYTTHFRIKLTGQLIDFFSNDNKSFKGILTNKITQFSTVISKHEERSIKHIISEQLMIDSILSTKVAHEIINTGLLDLPLNVDSSKAMFFDCSNIEVESKINTHYSDQYFKCPFGQSDSLTYIKIIRNNYTLLNEQLNLDSLYSNFISKLEKGKTYSSDGGFRMMYLPEPSPFFRIMISTGGIYHTNHTQSNNGKINGLPTLDLSTSVSLFHFIKKHPSAISLGVDLNSFTNKFQTSSGVSTKFDGETKSLVNTGYYYRVNLNINHFFQSSHRIKLGVYAGPSLIKQIHTGFYDGYERNSIATGSINYTSDIKFEAYKTQKNTFGGQIGTMINYYIGRKSFVTLNIDYCFGLINFNRTDVEVKTNNTLVDQGSITSNGNGFRASLGIRLPFQF